MRECGVRRRDADQPLELFDVLADDLSLPEDVVRSIARQLVTGPVSLESVTIHGSLNSIKEYRTQMRNPGVYGDAEPDYAYFGR